MDNSLKKKNSIFFGTKLPLGPAGQEFWSGSNVGMCTWKHADSTLRDPINKWKIL